MLSESWSPSLFCGMPPEAGAGADELDVCWEAGVDDDELDPPQPATASTSTSAPMLAIRLTGVRMAPLSVGLSRVCVNFMTGSRIVGLLLPRAPTHAVLDVS